MTTRCLVLFVLLAAASPAIAQEDARTLFQQGQTAYAQGDYEAAIRDWSRAWELDPRPLLQFNLSQAFERLGRIEEAVGALDQYLAHSDAADEHQADARARQAMLRERIERTSIHLVGGPDGAVILVDGEDHGRTPHPDAFRVRPGSHSIVVRAEGYADFTASVVVPAGDTAEVQVTLSAAAGGGGIPIGPIVLLSAGGAAIVAGAVLGGVAFSGAQSAFDGTPQAADARTLAAAADVTFAIGAAAAIAGVVWLVVAPGGAPSEASGTTLSIRPYGGTGGAGVAVDGRF